MKASIRIAMQILVAAVVLCSCTIARAQTSGSISGTVKDSAGAVVPDLAISVKNTATGVAQNTVSNAEGFYAFTVLPVGHYDLETFRAGFKPFKRTDLVMDIGTKLQLDIALEIGAQSEEVTVSENADVVVETQSTQMGEVVGGQVILSVGLNGRSFTDLLSLQPGIAPMSTQTGTSVVMAGVVTAITPSGNLNPGNQSINGQREDANGFLINGSDVKEEMNGGTAIIPNLDSISEFRVLTNNFDPEYGNYSGGIVNTVTKGGTDQLHGSAFEFLRNTSLDAKSFFATHTEAYNQNQFGGTIGGPIKKGKLFFFGDYQGTRTTQGISTGLVTVPSVAERGGNFAGGGISGVVQGDGLAQQLQDSLGYAVASGEPFFTPGCSSATCVFPNAVIPQSVWTLPSRNLLKYVPLPNVGPTTFSGDGNQRLRDDKTSYRMDLDNMRFGNLSGYYFWDDYTLDNPFPSGQGGATIPGFNGLNSGRAQLLNLSHTKTFGSATVNEMHFSYMRSSNVVGKPSGGLGVKLASQGFNVDPTTGGILPLAPQFEGVENTVFQGAFVMGVPITNVDQSNNTFTASESLSKIIGSHTLKAGIQVSFEQVNVNPNAIFDGTFVFDGYQTGNEFSDFLIGSPSQFNQQFSGAYYPRHKYAGWYGQDSWRIKSNLTLNYGLRVELMQYWSEKYDQVPTFVPGLQSTVYPKAFPGLVYPTDPGVGGAPAVPHTLVPDKYRFAPRIGLAYSPNTSDPFLKKIVGNSGDTSIRAGWAMLNSLIEGNSIGIDEPQPPNGFSGTVFNGLYVSPYNLADGTPNASPYPITRPPLNAVASHPNPIPFVGIYNPQSGMTAPVSWDTYPYAEDYFVSFERQLPRQTVLSISYVGSQAHHLPLVYSANPGSPGLCLALNQPGVLAAGESCGPGGENTTYDLVKALTFNGVTYPAGASLQGTRLGLNPTLVNDNVPGNFFGNDDYEGTIGNSHYNALQVTVKSRTKHLTYSLGYTYGRSIDQASSISDVVDPFNYDLTRGLSAWNLTHDFVGSYDYQLPLERISHRARRLLEGWEISGVTRISTGFPVTLSTDGDNSLQGSSPNGVNNRTLDLPDMVSGQSLNISSNPKGNGLVYFNPAAFTDNALGTPGNAGRRTFSGPGMFNTDLVLKRNFQISERHLLQFRWEAFNVFNHTQFFGPEAVNGDVDNPLFGQVVNAAPPRLMQLALKYTF